MNFIEPYELIEPIEQNSPLELYNFFRTSINFPQANRISTSLMFKGGAILKAFDANKNQSVKTPSSINVSIIFLLVSLLVLV